MCGFALRKALGQLQSIFPLHDGVVSLSPLSTIIPEEDAVRLWVEFFSDQIYLVPRSVFCEFLDSLSHSPSAGGAQQSDSMLLYLADFPSDNMVSAYKFFCLLSLFGPVRQLRRHILKYTRVGFVGLVNAWGALDMLRNQPPGTFLLRQSGTVPHLLTLSLVNPTGVSHCRQVEGSTVVSLLRKFKDRALTPLQLRLNQGRLVQLKTLDDLYSMTYSELYNAI